MVICLQTCVWRLMPWRFKDIGGRGGILWITCPDLCGPAKWCCAWKLREYTTNPKALARQYVTVNFKVVAFARCLQIPMQKGSTALQHLM